MRIRGVETTGASDERVERRAWKEMILSPFS